ncbi:zinc finger, CCHC-type containing protein [Tanacetum coccineum]
MRTIVVLVPTRNQSWNVGNVARLVTLRGLPKWLMQLRGGLILVLQLMFVKIVAGLIHMNRWKTDLYFTWKRKCRFGYYNNGMFMLNLNKVLDDSDSVYMSSLAVVNSSLWHARLGHVHYKRMLEMSKDELIHAIDENPDKYTTCMLTNITRFCYVYLLHAKDYGLSYVGYPSVLEGYSDASWINHVEDSSSTSGWVFLLGGGAISWASKKQTCITSSTMESEFVALAAAGKEAEWLRNLIHEIPIWPKPIAPISIRCDSAPTMARAYSQIYNGKSRHLGVRHCA